MRGSDHHKRAINKHSKVCQRESVGIKLTLKEKLLKEYFTARLGPFANSAMLPHSSPCFFFFYNIKTFVMELLQACREIKERYGSELKKKREIHLPPVW